MDDTLNTSNVNKTPDKGIKITVEGPLQEMVTEDLTPSDYDLVGDINLVSIIIVFKMIRNSDFSHSSVVPTGQRWCQRLHISLPSGLPRISWKLMKPLICHHLNTPTSHNLDMSPKQNYWYVQFSTLPNSMIKSPCQASHQLLRPAVSWPRHFQTPMTSTSQTCS